MAASNGSLAILCMYEHIDFLCSDSLAGLLAAADVVAVSKHALSFLEFRPPFYACLP